MPKLSQQEHLDTALIRQMETRISYHFWVKDPKRDPLTLNPIISPRSSLKYWKDHHFSLKNLDSNSSSAIMWL